MIKNFLSTFLFTLLLALSAKVESAGKIAVYGEIKEDLPKKSTNGTDEVLTKLLAIKGVDVEYAKCQKDTSIKLEKIPECIWGHLTPDLQKKVQQAYVKESSSTELKRDPASTSQEESLSLTTKSKQLSVDYMSDPAVVELSKILQKKLEEALVGDEEFQKDKKKIAVVDHAKFINIYRTELGKTIINAFTSYCIEADTEASKNLSIKSCKDTTNPMATCPLVILSTEDEKTSRINKNIESLKNANLNSDTEKYSNPESLVWTRCISSVGNVCYTAPVDFKGLSEDDERITRSKTKACLIMDYVKAARKNLIMADDQKKWYDGLGPGISLYVNNAKEVVINEKNSIDKITTVSSKEIEDSFKKKDEELKKEMNKCLDDSNKIIDTESCKKFISTETDTKQKAFAEFGIRQYALKSEIDNKFNDKKEVEKYLTEEGYEKSKITQMLSSDSELDQVKKEIKDRYNNERDAIVASMAKKISDQTTQDNGKIDSTVGSLDSKKLEAIKTELSSRSQDLEKLVHFNNIVSSYIEIDKGGGQKSRNVASLFAETENSSESFKKDSIEIKKKAAEASLKQEKGENAVDLSVDTLNSLFKYSTEKSNEKNKKTNDK